MNHRTRDVWSTGVRRTTLSLALGMCLLAGRVDAQSVTGTIFGDAAAGSTVVIANLDTGATYTVTADSNGRYSAPALPTGRYKVTLQQDGTIVSERENVRVLAGQGTEIAFDAADAETSMDAITVVGVNTIDVSTVESKLTLTKELLDLLPVAPNITQIALLAPGVIQGDSRYGNIAVFTGSSASENAYYINGFPTTQSLTQFGYTELPYNSVDMVQVSTGGYGVEYGRATGGVVSVVTASGTNEWRAGGQILYRPESLKDDGRDLYYGPNGRSGLAWGNAGQIYQQKLAGTDYRNVSLYAGGPIIKDRLFFYVAGEFVQEQEDLVRAFASSAAAVNTARTNGWGDYETELPRWLGKLDWYITDDHRIELTGLQDRRREHDEYSGFDYSTFSRVGAVVGGYDRDRNTHTYIANYTGYLTDDLTISAMYGKSKTEYEGGPLNYNPDCPTITIAAGAQAPGLTYGNCQLSSAPGYLPGRYDENTAFRFDVEYRIGDDHTLKVGLDSTEAESLVGASNNGLNFPGALGISFAGGFQWSYFRATNPNEAIYTPQGVGSPASAGGLGAQGYYVIRNVGTNISTPNVEQNAQYIKDLWQVTDNVLLELGLRNEQFENYASDGTSFIDFNTQLAPRFGATWDVHGDSSMKVFASLGRYHLALPNNVARRGVDGATNTSEAFVYSGVDPNTGVPTGLIALGPVYSPNNEFGQSRDGRSFAPTSLKSHYQDTFAAGVERAFSFGDFDFNSGAKFTFSRLGSAIDDFCDSRPVYEWAETNGAQYTDAQIDEVADFFGHCVLINPGEANTYQYDIDGNGTYDEIHLTKEMLKFPPLERDYMALDVFVERPFDGKWYARLDYTLSKSEGNLEGQLNSDIGQIDVSTTLAGDYYELAVNANGYLPNDRRHQLKLNGFYQLNDEWGMSALLTYASGRPRNCRGAYPNIDPQSPNYGSYHFFCNGQAVPRGTFGRLPPSTRLDLGLRYTPNWADDFEFGLNIYNVANRQSLQNVAELYNQGASSTTINANWGLPISYSTPRYFEFVMRYDWGSGDRAVVVEEEAILPPAPAPVPTCADKDDDGDGTNNCDDKCPNSTAGQTTGPDGCPVPEPAPEETMEPQDYKG